MDGFSKLTLLLASPLMGGYGMILLRPWLRDAIDQGDWAINIDPNVIGNCLYYQATPADQDAYHWSTFMRNGIYTCKLIGTTNTSHGIIKIKIDGVVVATWDQYAAAGPNYNQISVTAAIEIDSPGVKTIQVIVDGKNGSSSSYYGVLSEVGLYQTS